MFDLVLKLAVLVIVVAVLVLMAVAGVVSVAFDWFCDQVEQHLKQEARS